MKESSLGKEPTARFLRREELRVHPERSRIGHELIEQRLRAAGFRGGISTEQKYLKAYSTDESIFSIKPQMILQPRDGADVERAVRVVASEIDRFPALSLTPRAAGTGLSGGSLTDSIVIDVCSHLHHIHDISTHRGVTTITLDPGVPWRAMERRLKEHGVYVPSYPASKDICSIGGAVANNAAGPDTLRYGHTADWVESLEVVLHDGKTYTIKQITHKEYTNLIKRHNAYADILKRVMELLEEHETSIHRARPKTKKNTAGYALWDVLSGSVADFKKGKSTMDMTRLFSGSQGTIGIITQMTLRTIAISKHTTLLAVPIFDLSVASHVVTAALPYNPINLELFDALTFELALKNPGFFKPRMTSASYYHAILSMYTTYHVRWLRRTPELVFLITLDRTTNPEPVLAAIRKAGGTRARVVTNTDEVEMFWQIRRASFSLTKLMDQSKRPAAFLEDMVVPPEDLGKFFAEIQRLFKKYSVRAAVHGHGGNGHFHFYPLLDFTKKTTGDLVTKMAEDFYDTALKHHGTICGEHNDGIIRTPHLDKLFSKKMLAIFAELEHIFDPDDIFNPGKKVNPRFDIKQSLRHEN